MSRRLERAASLHRLRSTLARIKAELELAEADAAAPPVDRLLEDVEEALELLSRAEDAEDAATRVLVADDDSRLAEVTARGLRRLGLAAEASPSLRTLRAGEVLVVDLGLLSGAEPDVLPALAAARPIVVSGASDNRSRALAARCNASDYLVKPVDLAVLAAAIRHRVSEA